MSKLRFSLRSIKTKMTVAFGLVVLAGCLVLWLASANRAGELIKAEAEEGMSKVIKQYAANLATRQDSMKNMVVSIAENKIISGDAPMADKLAVLAEELPRKEKQGFKRLGLIDKSGKAYYPNGLTADLSDREYFKQAIAGKACISSSIISKVDSTLSFAVASPVRNPSTGEVTGVVFGIVDGAQFSQSIAELSYGKTGYGFAVDGTGKMIGHKDFNLTLNQVNYIEESKTKPELAELAAVMTRMAKGETGVAAYTYQGEKKYAAFAPVPESGWSVAINVPVDEVLDKTSALNQVLLVVSAVVLILSLALTYWVARGIAMPIEAAAAHLGVIAGGDFTTPVPDKYLNRSDEIGQMAHAVNKLQQDMRPLIGGVRGEVKTLAAGSESLSAAAQQVASSSNEVGRAIQEVASGATNQATSLQDVVNLIGEITSQLDHVYAKLGHVKQNSDDTSRLADKGKQEINLLTSSIENVKHSFAQVADKLNNLDQSVGQVGEIVGVITGIAEQTNLLALNAAIEAARAGEAGRGFAVVADEVRKLAEQSRSSTDKIKTLLNAIGTETGEVVATARTTQSQLTSQMDNVKNTILSFDNILSSIATIAPTIAAAYQEMDRTVTAKDVVLDRVQSVSAVAEQTSAASEEIAASSQELTASTEEIAAGAQQVLEVAKRLNSQIERFKV